MFKASYISNKFVSIDFSVRTTPFGFPVDPDVNNICDIEFFSLFFFQF